MIHLKTTKAAEIIIAPSSQTKNNFIARYFSYVSKYRKTQRSDNMYCLSMIFVSPYQESLGSRKALLTINIIQYLFCFVKKNF